MLHITASTKILKEEARIAHNLINEIIKALRTSIAQDNLSNTIGIFVVQMPQFKVLAKDAEDAKQILRKVCTREITPKDALSKFEKAHSEIYLLDSILNQLPI